MLKFNTFNLAQTAALGATVSLLYVWEGGGGQIGFIKTHVYRGQYVNKKISKWVCVEVLKKGVFYSIVANSDLNPGTTILFS